MAHYRCLIQEGQTADRMRGELEARLRSLAEETFGEAPADVEVGWQVVKQGYGWTAGEPSSTSLIVRSVPEGWAADEREVFMRKVVDMWSVTTGCTVNEVVVTTWDGPLPL